MVTEGSGAKVGIQMIILQTTEGVERAGVESIFNVERPHLKRHEAVVKSM